MLVSGVREADVTHTVLSCPRPNFCLMAQVVLENSSADPATVEARVCLTAKCFKGFIWISSLFDCTIEALILYL